RGAPEFAAAATLVPPHVGIGYEEFLDAGEEPAPGIRSQIAVADHDRDGKLDLLLGDFCTYLVAREGLTPEERREIADLRRGMDELRPRLEAARSRLDAQLEAEFSDWTGGDSFADGAQEKYSKRRDEVYEDPEFQKLSSEYGVKAKALHRFVRAPELPRRPGESATTRGYVWLFRRK
ncbi:MAG: hypothetical protein ACREID_03760, partial [Planctomycetota bacterium]